MTGALLCSVVGGCVLLAVVLVGIRPTLRTGAALALAVGAWGARLGGSSWAFTGLAWLLGGSALALGLLALRQRFRWTILLIPASLMGLALVPPPKPKPPELPRVSSGILRLPRYNVRFDPPAEPWVSLDPSQLSRDCQAAYMRVDPTVYLDLRFELEDGEHPPMVAEVAELAKGRERSRSRSFRLVEEEPYSLNGLAGLRVTAEAEQGRGRTTRVLWVYAHNGFTYELRAWGDAGTPPETVRLEAERAFSGFDLIDRERVADASDNDAAPDFRSARYGYSVPSLSPGWFQWSSVSREVPGADYGTVSDDEASLVVLAFSLLGRDPDLETLTRGLLTELDVEYPGDGVSPCRAVSVDGLDGCDYFREGSVDGARYSYAFRVLKGRGFAYLIASWAPQKLSPARVRGVLDLRSRVRFHAASPPTATRLLPDERGAYSRAFNEMGLASYDKERYEDALKFFRIAFELEHDDAVVLQNVVETFVALGRLREGLTYLDKYSGAFPHESELSEWRDYLKDQIEQEREDSLANKSA